MSTTAVAATAGQHVCGITPDRALRAEMAARWVREGLDTGEQVLWVEPPEGELLRWLDDHDVDWRGPLETGQLRIAPPEDVVELASAADIPMRIARAARLTHDAVEQGYAGLRVGVETAVALTRIPDIPTQLGFEAAWEELTRQVPLSLLCVYDPAVHGLLLHDGITLHPRDYDDGLAAGSAAHGTVRLRGEIDVSNAARVGVFLASAAADPAVLSGEVRMELGALEFIDVAGLNQLLAFARARRPHRVRLEAPPYALRRMLELTRTEGQFSINGEAPR